MNEMTENPVCSAGFGDSLKEAFSIVMWRPIETIPFGEYVLVTDGNTCVCARYHEIEGGYRAHIAGTGDADVRMWLGINGRKSCHRDAKWWAPVPMLPAT